MGLKKILFIVINVILANLGFALMVIGAVMHDKGDTLRKDEVTSLFNEVSFDDNLKLGNVTNSLSILLICLGVFIIVIAAFGNVAHIAFRDSSKRKTVLIAYAIIVLFLFVVQLVALGLWCTMARKVDSKLQGELANVLYSYAGVTSTNKVSIGWDLLFLRLDCCGVDPIGSSSNSDEFSGSKWWNERNGTDYKVPVSCCIGTTEDNYISYPNEAACQENLITHRKKGCYQELKDWLYGYEVSAIIFSVLLIITEIAAIVIAVLLILLPNSQSVAPERRAQMHEMSRNTGRVHETVEIRGSDSVQTTVILHTKS